MNSKGRAGQEATFDPGVVEPLLLIAPIKDVYLQTSRRLSHCA